MRNLKCQVPEDAASQKEAITCRTSKLQSGRREYALFLLPKCHPEVKPSEFFPALPNPETMDATRNDE